MAYSNRTTVEMFFLRSNKLPSSRMTSACVNRLLGSLVKAGTATSFEGSHPEVTRPIGVPVGETTLTLPRGELFSGLLPPWRAGCLPGCRPCAVWTQVQPQHYFWTLRHLVFASFPGLTRLRVTNRLKTTGTDYSHGLEARRLAGGQEPAGLCSLQRR